MVDLSAEAPSDDDQIVRTTFSSEDAGFKFYNSYALEKGFSVRKDYVERDGATNQICLRKFVCSRQGFREQKHMKDVGKKRKARKITRCGCLAKMTIALNKETEEWYVKQFIDKHNHSLDTPDIASPRRSHRGISYEQKADIVEMEYYPPRCKKKRHDQRTCSKYKEMVNQDCIVEDEAELLASKHGDMKVVCSPTRYATVVQGLSDKHKTVIKNAGFQGMLHMKKIHLRRLMLVKIAKRYIINTQSFLLCGKEVAMTPSDVSHIMGLPIQGNNIDVSAVTQINKELFYAYKSKKPKGNQITLKALEQSITASKDPDDDFIRQFVLYTIGIILAPTTKDHVDSKYLAFVEKVTEIPKFNWGQFTLTHLLGCIHSFTQADKANLQGNLALLQFWYWEHIQPYSQHGVSYSPAPHPLMARWDEQNAKLRTHAYDADGLDGGVVIMAFENAPRNTVNDPARHEGQEETQHNEKGAHHLHSKEHLMTNEQVEIILQAITKNHIEMKNAILQAEHRLSLKNFGVQEDLAEYRKQDAIRVCTVEDGINDIKREMQDIKNALNTRATLFKCQYFQEEASVAEEEIRATNEGYGTLPGSANLDTRTYNTNNNLKNKKIEQLEIEPIKKSAEPIFSSKVFNDDYILTQHDEEALQFIRHSYESAIVVDLPNNLLTVEKLVPLTNDDGWLCDVVIDAYVSLNSIENSHKSVVTTSQSWLLRENEIFEPRKKKRLAGDIGKRCATRELVFVPLNVSDCHWILLVLNFGRKEIQILNSLASNPKSRDWRKETTLVNSLQACIEYAVEDGLVSPAEPIDLNLWDKHVYTNIPQQKDRSSCGVYVIKYILAWNGVKMCETFTKEQMSIFRKKICSRLLDSESNQRRRASYSQPIKKEEYLANNPEHSVDQGNVSDDDVEIVIKDSISGKK